MLVCVDCGEMVEDLRPEINYFLCFDCIVEQGEY
jgi:NMD protein affecting ribosome stability and mRNA decay